MNSWRSGTQLGWTALLLGALSGCTAVPGGNPDGSTGPARPPAVPGSTDLGSALGPADLGLSRLTKSQYRNVVVDAFGFDPVDFLDLEEDHFDGGFASVGARAVAISRTGVTQYEGTAVATAKGLATAERYAGTSNCSATDGSRSCFEASTSYFARRLFRRTPTSDEISRYATVAENAYAETSDTLVAFEIALTGLLLSPHFLYQHEETSVAGDGTTPVLTPWALANRLAFLLWDSAPDEALLAAAESGRLDTLEGLTVEVDRMLADRTKVARGLEAFASGYLSLYRIGESPKDPVEFPGYSGDLEISMVSAAKRSIVSVVLDSDAPFRSLLTSTTSFLDARLAAHLGVPGEHGVNLSEWDWGTESLRGGILTEPAVLALTARASETSPTLRGLFVKGLLCTEIPPPPVGVNTTIAEPTVPTTRRAAFEQHMSEPSCSGCHSLMDPPGFALEYFDAVGRSRETDSGFPIDGSGTLEGATFDGPRELGAVLAEDPDFEACLTEKWLTHALGRDVHDKADMEIEAYGEVLAENGGRVIPLLRAISLSSAFRLGAKR